MRVRDYPGEEKFRKEALQDIGSLENRVVLILLLLVEYVDGQFTGENKKNGVYYNAQFVHAVRACLQTAERKLTSVFVVINKADMFPPHWDDDIIIAEVKSANPSAIDNIETCFGEGIKYRVTSAYTNKGVISLLADVGKAILHTAEDKDRLQRFLDEKAKAAESR